MENAIFGNKVLEIIIIDKLLSDFLKLIGILSFNESTEPDCSDTYYQFRRFSTVNASSLVKNTHSNY